MITSKQKDNILQFSDEDIVELLQICVIRLQPVTVKEYAKMVNVSTRQVYYGIESESIKYLQVASNKYPIYFDKNILL